MMVSADRCTTRGGKDNNRYTAQLRCPTALVRRVKVHACAYVNITASCKGACVCIREH
jgi:hypothetical protein